LRDKNPNKEPLEVLRDMAIKVNGREISEQAIRYEYDRLVKFYSQHMSAERLKELSSEIQEKAKEQAIGSHLLVEEAKKLDIRVPRDEIQTRFDEMVKNAGGEEEFKALLQKQGMSEDMVRTSIEEGRKVDKLVERKLSDIPEPTEKDMEEYFENHKGDYVRPEMAQVQHILVKPDSGQEEDKKTAKSKLLTIRERIQQGSSFAEEASAHSECASGSKSGGSLGWVQRGMILPELDDIVFSIEKGEISDVVETSLGMHILRKTAEEEGGEASYDEAREKIRDYLRHLYRGQALSDFVEELKQKAVIEQE
jgi:parvulin-like peptidyl-prolyl isomerase